MQIDIMTRGLSATQRLTRFAKQQVKRTLGRVSDPIQSVTVRISDINGPKGGDDKECVLRIHAPRQRPLIIRTLGQEPHAALMTCLQRAKRVLTEAPNARRQHRERLARRDAKRLVEPDAPGPMFV